MLRRHLILILLPILLIPVEALAETNVHVLILPYTIHAEQDLSYLQNDIPKVIGKELQADGAVLIESRASLPTGANVDEIRKMGLDAGADSVVWGSMTRIGENISLDTSIVETVGTKPVQSVYEAGTGIENLRMVAKKTADKLARQLFRREIISDIRIEGNKRIESDAIERVIRTSPGNPVRAGDLSKDVKNIYNMGYFDDIRVEAEESGEGKTIVFHVKEKPTIRKISFSGNRVYDDEKMRENLTISTGSILNIFTIKSNIEQLEIMYKEKNYHNVKVSYTAKDLKNNQADIEFVVEEGEKIKIKTITFQGNTTFDAETLKKQIKTNEKGFWSWLTSSGELNREDLSQDVSRLMAFYHTTGFIHAKIADPAVVFEGDWIYITFKIEEGERYKVGMIDITGDLIRPKERIMPSLSISKEPFFNREIVRQDVLSLSDLCADVGYAYADVSPLTREHPETHLVDITYDIKKNSKVYFETITITGNTRTRDKVIRRELHINEEELYSSRKLKRSVRNLNRLDYFEDIKVETPKGSDDDKMNVNIEVAEKPTGNFTFGAGYSTVDDFFVTGSVTQRNFLGKGQILKLSGQIGGSSDLYNLSFTEPYINDTPLSGTANIYRTSREYDTYDRTSTGGALGVSYPIFDYTRVGVSYRYDITTIDEIDEIEASDNVKELEGRNATSAITTYISYDSRDKTFNTTEGQDHRLSYTYAGIGGDIGFNKVVGELGWYTPIYKGLVNFLHAEAGYVAQSNNLLLPDYEKFYLGGMNSLRGFDYQDVHIDTINSNDEPAEEGGEKYVQFNVEFTYPIFKDVGIVGVVFYDTGNVFDDDEDINLGNLRESVGYGFRWYSPIGPIRIECGYILDPEDGESSSGNWEFSMGTSF